MQNCFIKLLLVSLVVIVAVQFFGTNSASAVPVAYNQTSLVIPWQTVPRNSSSFDMFMDLPSTLLWMKFNNNTLDSSPSLNNGTITYNTNLIRLYKFENNTINSVTGSSNGTVTGTKQYVSGYEGKAFSFDGASYITVGTVTALNFERTNSFSTSFDIKYTTAGTTGVLGNSATSRGWSVDTNGGTLELDLRNTVTTNELRVSTVGTYNDGNWHHVAITYDGSSTPSGIKIYVDGSSVTTSTLANTLSATIVGGSFSVGSFGSGILKYSGLLDEARIYNSQLSAAQAQALYMVGKYQQSHTFDGGEYILAPSGSLPSGSSDRTVSSWIKIPNPTSGSYQSVIAWGSASISHEFNILISPTGHIFVNGFSNDVISNSVISPNVWTNVVVTVGSSGTVRAIYINGVLDIQSTTTALNTGSSTNFSVGWDNVEGQYFLTGQLDDLVISNTVWTQAQVTQNYNSEFTFPTYNPNIVTSWYHGVSGSATITKKLGIGPSTLTMSCTWSNTVGKPVSNYTNIYYLCTSGNIQSFNKVNVGSTVASHLFSNGYGSGPSVGYNFVNNKQFIGAAFSGYNQQFTSINGNTTTCQNGGAGCAQGTVVISNQKVGVTGTPAFIRFNFNNTGAPTTQALTSTQSCEFLSSSNSSTPTASNIACDQAFQANTTRYTEGMMIAKNAVYGTNSSLPFFTAINADSNGNLLSIPSAILGKSTDPNTRLILSANGVSYYIMVDSSNIFFVPLQSLQSQLINENRAFQSYLLVPYGNTDSKLGFPSTGMPSTSIMLYGIGLNTTVTKYGEMTIPSGFTAKTSSIQSAVRTLDPQWTNLGMSPYTAMTTGSSSNFAVILTVSNAPADGGLQLVYSPVTWTNQNSVWCVTQLDTTHTAECDIPPDQCPLIYVADISKLPLVYNYEGTVCANGVNQKTVSYTQTLPLTFYTMQFAASSSFTPSTNGLTTTFRTSDTTPTTYTVIIKNSTGVIASNSTFTFNGTLDTRNFNVSGVTKPAALYVSVPGHGTIYTAYMGSPLSLASVSSFFHQYLSYQGFDLVSFIPVIFAAMFTRNSVGVGAVMVVLCIATLSWLSVSVVPDVIVYISIFIAILSMIGYRTLGY